jgi:hypothetical protein
VSKRPKGKTFADVVREVEQQPVVPDPDYSGIVDPSGKRWHRDEAEVSPARALELAGDGASVAWDNCGFGCCPFYWYTPEDVARMVAAGTPEVRRTKRRRGSLGVWTSGDGDVLVVAEGAVQWGDVISG